MMTKRFYHFIAILYFGMFFGSFNSSAYKFIPGKEIRDDLLSLIGGFGTVFNGIARLTWGKFQDDYGFKKILKVVLPC